MSRQTFGADASLGTVLIAGGSPIMALPNAVCRFYTAQSGGTQVTDLLDVNGNPTATIMSNANGTMPLFSGPASGLTVMWVDAGAGRYKIYCDPTAAYAALAPAVADSVHMHGHSYAAGVNVSGLASNLVGFAWGLADMLGLPLRNEGIGGTTLYSYVGGGAAWPNELQKTTHPRRFSPSGGFHVSMFGINDIAQLGNTLLALAPFIMAQRVVITRWRAGVVFENDDASVVLGGAGSWGSAAGTAANSGNNIAYNDTNGATITVTTPGDMPSTGTVFFGPGAWTDGGGAVFTATIGGVVYSIDTRLTSTSGNRSCAVIRGIPSPGPNATIVWTTSNVTGAIGAMFDYWGWEPPEADCPLVVLVKQPHPLDYTAYGSTPPAPPTDAGVDIMNAAFDSLAAEFGARVITVDTSSLNNSSAYFTAGNVHPNAAGHLAIAQLIRNAVTGLLRIQHTPQIAAPRVEYATAAPTGADRNYYIGDTVWNTAPTPGAPPGWVCTTAGAPGTWSQMEEMFVGEGEVTLVAGTVTVANANITSTSRIVPEQITPGGTPGALFVSAKVGGTSFTIKSTSATDTSVVLYKIKSYT